MHGEQPRHALDHDAPRIRKRLADERDPRRRAAFIARKRAHPFGAGARLAGAAAAEHQPGGPVAAALAHVRRQLVVARPQLEIVTQPAKLPRVQTGEELIMGSEPD